MGGRDVGFATTQMSNVKDLGCIGGGAYHTAN